MRKIVLAFLIAPLWVPAAAIPFAVFVFPHPEQRHWIYFTTIIAAIFAYGGVAALGLPAFLILRNRKHTSFWIAPALGFGVGIVTLVAFLALFALSLGSPRPFANVMPNSLAQWLTFLLTGALGAAVGATLWLIARPDHAGRAR